MFEKSSAETASFIGENRNQDFVDEEIFPGFFAEILCNISTSF